MGLQVQAASGGQGPAEAYGLLGLLGVINMNDTDVTMLALGTDLTSLGLHLNGMDALYLTFASPWADAPIKPEPAFKVRIFDSQPASEKEVHLIVCSSMIFRR